MIWLRRQASRNNSQHDYAINSFAVPNAAHHAESRLTENNASLFEFDLRCHSLWQSTPEVPAYSIFYLSFIYTLLVSANISIIFLDEHISPRYMPSRVDLIVPAAIIFIIVDDSTKCLKYILIVMRQIYL